MFWVCNKTCLICIIGIEVCNDVARIHCVDVQVVVVVVIIVNVIVYIQDQS